MFQVSFDIELIVDDNSYSMSCVVERTIDIITFADKSINNKLFVPIVPNYVLLMCTCVIPLILLIIIDL